MAIKFKEYLNEIYLRGGNTQNYSWSDRYQNSISLGFVYDSKEKILRVFSNYMDRDNKKIDENSNEVFKDPNNQKRMVNHIIHMTNSIKDDNFHVGIHGSGHLLGRAAALAVSDIKGSKGIPRWHSGYHLGMFEVDRS